MKNSRYIILFISIATVLLAVFLMKNVQDKKAPLPNEQGSQKGTSEQATNSKANPASKFCEENSGKVEIVTEKDGSQFGMCKFEDYSCEEWAYYKGECTLEEDSEKIKKALIDKGLNLTGMKVVIYKHFGKYIEGGVVPVSTLGGGGYVFAVKEDGQIKVLADGNGAIMCNALSEYPEFPAYLVPECIDEKGNQVSR